MNIEAYFNIITKSQWWPASRILEFQRSLLAPLLDHAKHTSPFYKYRLSPVYGSGRSINWEKWRDIPILTRADLAKYSDRIASINPPSDHGPFSTVTSSGSTGHPISMRASRWQLDMARAVTWRAHQWHELDWSKPLLTRNYVLLPDKKSGEDLGPWGPPWLDAARRGRMIYSPYTLPIESYFDLLASTRPDYAMIYTGSIEQLAILKRKQNVSVGLNMFIARGAGVTDYDRKVASEEFKAGIFELYSSQECGALAHPCPSGSGFHISCEAAFVEVIRDDGLPANEDEDGRIIVTPLGSTATPLIRYDQGDRAIMGGQCSCGRGLPLIKKILGRTHHAFRHPNGQIQFGARVGHSRGMIGARQWQISQVGPTNFLIKYVADRQASPEQMLQFIDHFQDNIFRDAAIEFECVDEIPLSPSGKYQEYQNLWKNS